MQKRTECGRLYVDRRAKRLGGDAVVTVVQTADFWNDDDTTGGRRCDWAQARSVLVKRESGSRPHVVRDVFSEHAGAPRANEPGTQ